MLSHDSFESLHSDGRDENQPVKYFLTSLGCPKNLVESEEMMAKLSLSGMVLVHDPEEADLLVVNTCGFIEPAKEETIGVILDLIEIKQQFPQQRLMVVGCLVQRYRKELCEEIQEVDAFVGVEDKETFLDVAWKVMGRKRLQQNTNLLPFMPRLLTTPPHLAYLRVSDGCSHQCSFCAIPRFLGPLRSRPIEEIEQEAKALAAGGVKELVLIAQDTTSYGYDLYGRFALTDLLARLEPIEGIEWIRIMYAYPQLVDRKLADYFAGSDKLVSYLDIPIQHGDPEILKAMRRGSSDKHIRQAAKRIRAARSDMTIRTTLIVGFPGEKTRHFQTMTNLLEELEFDRVGVFKFSREEDTPAAYLSNQVSDRIKEKRYQTLIQWAAEKARVKNERFIGEIIPVLIDGKSPDGNGYLGRYQGQAPEVDGEVHVRGDNLIVGRFAPVRITEADEDNLYGFVNVEITALSL